MLKTMLLAAVAVVPFPMLRRPAVGRSGVGQLQPAFNPVEPRFDAVDAVVDDGDARFDRRRAHLQVGHVGGDAVELFVDAAQVAQNEAVGIGGHGRNLAAGGRTGNSTALLRGRVVLQRRVVPPHEAMPRFVDWLRDNDFSGWHTAADIGEFYRWFCHDEGIEEMPAAMMRERFAVLPGVDKARRRIAESTDKQLVHIRRWRAKGEEKPVLYRIASHEEAAEALATRRQQRASKHGSNKKSPPAPAGATARRAA